MKWKIWTSDRVPVDGQEQTSTKGSSLKRLWHTLTTARKNKLAELSRSQFRTPTRPPVAEDAPRDTSREGGATLHPVPQVAGSTQVQSVRPQSQIDSADEHSIKMVPDIHRVVEEVSQETGSADTSGRFDRLHDRADPQDTEDETLEELVSQISRHEIGGQTHSPHIFSGLKSALNRVFLRQQANTSNPHARFASPFNGLGRAGKSSSERLVRRMWIVPEGVSDPSGYKCKYGKLDTGAQVSITYECVLKELGLDYHHVPCPPVQPLGNKQDASELMYPKGQKLLMWYDGGDKGFKEELIERFYVLASPENRNRPCDFLLSGDFVLRLQATLGQGIAEVSMLSMVFPGYRNSPRQPGSAVPSGRS